MLNQPFPEVDLTTRGIPLRRLILLTEHRLKGRQYLPIRDLVAQGKAPSNDAKPLPLFGLQFSLKKIACDGVAYAASDAYAIIVTPKA